MCFLYLCIWWGVGEKGEFVGVWSLLPPSSWLSSKIHKFCFLMEINESVFYFIGTWHNWCSNSYQLCMSSWPYKVITETLNSCHVFMHSPVLPYTVADLHVPFYCLCMYSSTLFLFVHPCEFNLFCFFVQLCSSRGSYSKSWQRRICCYFRDRQWPITFKSHCEHHVFPYCVLGRVSSFVLKFSKSSNYCFLLKEDHDFWNLHFHI